MIIFKDDDENTILCLKNTIATIKLNSDLKQIEITLVNGTHYNIVKYCKSFEDLDEYIIEHLSHGTTIDLRP